MILLCDSTMASHNFHLYRQRWNILNQGLKGKVRNLLYQKQTISAKRKLQLIDKLFLVLVRLRIRLSLGDLSDKFCVSTGLLSIILTTWVT